jgi:hypothetical protein
MNIDLVNGATIVGLDIRMRPALIEAGKIYESFGHPLTITCGLNGEHSPGSFHPFGRAIDLRTNFFTEEERRLVVTSLREALRPLGFDVVIHATHIHIEYDPK